MAINIPRGGSDRIIEAIVHALRDYESDHPKARIDLYRQNPASVRVRVIDPDFEGLSRSERHKLVWKYFDKVSDDDQADISMILLLRPDEVESSFGNLEFEDPVASVL